MTPAKQRVAHCSYGEVGGCWLLGFRGHACGLTRGDASATGQWSGRFPKPVLQLAEPAIGAARTGTCTSYTQMAHCPWVAAMAGDAPTRRVTLFMLASTCTYSLTASMDAVTLITATQGGRYLWYQDITTTLVPVYCTSVGSSCVASTHRGGISRPFAPWISLLFLVRPEYRYLYMLGSETHQVLYSSRVSTTPHGTSVAGDLHSRATIITLVPSIIVRAGHATE